MDMRSHHPTSTRQCCLEKTADLGKALIEGCKSGMRTTKTWPWMVFFVVLVMSMTMSPLACSQSDGSDWVGTTPLEEALTNGKPTVAEFGAGFCVPCKRMKPILEELVAEHGDKLDLSFVDVYERRDLAGEYEIVSIPTQIFFDSTGKEVARHVGFWPEENVVAQLQEMGVL